MANTRTRRPRRPQSPDPAPDRDDLDLDAEGRAADERAEEWLDRILSVAPTRLWRDPVTGEWREWAARMLDANHRDGAAEGGERTERPPEVHDGVDS